MCNDHRNKQEADGSFAKSKAAAAPGAAGNFRAPQAMPHADTDQDPLVATASVKSPVSSPTAVPSLQMVNHTDSSTYQTLLTIALPLLQLLRDEKGVPKRKLTFVDILDALNHLGFATSFIEAAIILLQRHFRDRDLTHRELAIYLRLGRDRPKPRALPPPTVAAYEHPVGSTSSRSPRPVLSLPMHTKAAAKAAALTAPAPAPSGPQLRARVAAPSASSGANAAKAGTLRSAEAATLGASTKDDSGTASGPRRPKHRLPLHSASAPALPTISQTRVALVPEGEGGVRVRLAISENHPPPRRPLQPAPDRSWAEVPRKPPAFSFGRASRWGSKDVRLEARLQAAAPPVPLSPPRRDVFGATKGRLPETEEAKLLVDGLRTKLRANKAKVKDVLDSLDIDGDGELGTAELKAALLALMKPEQVVDNEEAEERSDRVWAEPSEQVMEEVMRFFDRDDSGSISAHELKRALLASGQLLSKELRTGGAGKLNVYGVNRNALRTHVEGVWLTGGKLLAPTGEVPTSGEEGQKLLDKMRKALCKHKDHVIAIFRGESNRMVSQQEFCDAVAKLFGMAPPAVSASGAQSLRWAIEAVFASWTGAGTGTGGGGGGKFASLSVTDIQKMLNKGGQNTMPSRTRRDAIFQHDITRAVEESWAEARRAKEQAIRKASKQDLHGIVIKSREEQLEMRAQRVAPVQLEELLAVMAEDCEELVQLFVKWDTDGDGTVGRDEFSAAVSKMGFKFAPEVSEELFSFFDKDNGGSVTLQEIEATLKWGRDRKSARPLLAGWQQLTKLVDAHTSLHEQLASKLVAQGQTPQSMFRGWDESGDGVLDKAELGQVMVTICGMTLSDKELDQLFKSFDLDNSGTISFRELNSKLKEEVPVEQLMNALAAPEVEENLFRLFHTVWDQNGDGVLDRCEFVAALNGLGLDVKNLDDGSAFDDLFRMLDEDGSGTISLRELQNSLRWIRSCEKCERLRHEAYDFEGTLSIQTQIRRALAANAVRVMDLFREWDENGDGVLEKAEFARAMPMLGIHAGREEVDDLFNSMDGDGDGIVTFKEFNRQLRRESEAMLNEMDDGSNHGPSSRAWRPKTPSITIADVDSLRETVKMENKLRGLEDCEIKEPIKPKPKPPVDRQASRRQQQ